MVGARGNVFSCSAAVGISLGFQHEKSAKGAHQDFQLLRLLCVALLGNALVQVLVRQAQNGQPA